eukprot:CAMPEP_0170560892 /NCGR_PEP_ID=MMETSP0211-20121228/51680_1 /TAXON_ID=311385 /ORGANISM="Pseudokeronopsis sp., Strain OXSARD2" /LENGTH=44 /DNA_ID= /DNA_START= /DNA_END= /DNA_ORIENTATION=
MNDLKDLLSLKDLEVAKHNDSIGNQIYEEQKKSNTHRDQKIKFS